MIEESSIERRKLERFDLQLPVRIESMSPTEEGGVIELFTSDICSGGAFFRTPQPLREGMQVKVVLVLSFDKLKRLKRDWHKALIKVNGRVVRCEPQGMAISFDPDYEFYPTGESATS